MTKKVLKRLLLITLALCTLMLGTVPALAEQTDQEPYVCLLGDSAFFSPFYTYLSKLGDRIHIIESLDELVENNDETSPCWVFVINTEHDRFSVNIPDGLNYQSIIFVDSITTPKGADWEERISLWNEYLLGFLHKGIPVYCYATTQPGAIFYAELVIQHHCEYLDALVTAPESGIKKGEENEGDIAYLVSADEAPEAYGQLIFHLIDEFNGNPFSTMSYVAERFMQPITDCLK